MTLGPVAVVGYGNQGRAHALNLRDSEVPVLVGARDGGRAATRAHADGFDVRGIAAAVARARVVAMLLPDEVLTEVFNEVVSPFVAAGSAIVLAHGSALEFGGLHPDPSLDVCLVAPTGPGTELRERFVAGGGIPAVWAVHHNATGRASEIAVEYAHALGCTRAGLFPSSVREESVIDLFGEQAVLCGSLAALVSAGFRTLVERGYSPELAYLECVHQLRLTSGLVSDHGVDGMWDRISRTARFGGLQRGAEIVGEGARRAMEETLDRIESGRFFREFLDDCHAGGGKLAAMRAEARDSGLEEVGERFRELAERGGGAPRGGNQNKS